MLTSESGKVNPQPHTHGFIYRIQDISRNRDHSGSYAKPLRGGAFSASRCYNVAQSTCLEPAVARWPIASYQNRIHDNN
jgi:hypothetical protein